MRRMRIFYIFISFYFPRFYYGPAPRQRHISAKCFSIYPFGPPNPWFISNPKRGVSRLSKSGLSGFYGKLRVLRPQHRLISFYCPNSREVGGRWTCSSSGRPDNQRQFQFQFRIATWPRPPISTGEFLQFSLGFLVVLFYIAVDLRAEAAWNSLKLLIWFVN